MRDLIIGTLLSATVSGNSPPTPLAYDPTLGCGACINNGYVFCQQAPDAVVVASTDPLPTTKCCQDATCAEANDVAWSCSNTFIDRIYALSMCPFKVKQCGTIQNAVLDDG